MSRDRFSLILRFLHLNDNSKRSSNMVKKVVDLYKTIIEASTVTSVRY